MTRRDLGVQLSPAQVQICKGYANLIIEARQRFEEPGARVVDKTRTPENVELMGYMGEMAVCQATGWQPNWKFVPCYDEGRDFIVHDIAIQVKTGMNEMARSLMFKTTNDFKLYVDVAIYVQYAGQYQYEPEKDPYFIVCGYIPRVEFMKNHKTKDFGRGVGPQPYMDKDDLLCIDDLIALIRQKGEL